MNVLFAHDGQGMAEIANDWSGDVANFWRVLGNDVLFPVFHNHVACTPFSEKHWRDAAAHLASVPTSPWDQWDVTEQWTRAAYFFILARQSMAGRFARNPAFAAVTTARLRQGMNEQVAAWWGALANLPATAERLSRVLLLSMDCVALAKKYAARDKVMMYFDPPWMAETRDAPEVYDVEMSAKKHEELLKVLTASRGAFVAISGRRCALYEDVLTPKAGWDSFDIPHKSSSGGGRKKRDMVHTLWVNYDLEDVMFGWREPGK